MIFYILGCTVLVTFIACVIHYFVTGSNLYNFFTENGGWLTIAFCANLGLGIIGCIYLSFWFSFLMMLTIGAILICGIYMYNENCADSLREYLIDDYGWVMVLLISAIGLTLIGCIYWSVGWSLLIGLTIILSISSVCLFSYEVSFNDLKELMIDNNLFVFPLFFVTLALTIASAVLFSTGRSLIIGITLLIMIIASTIHYTSLSCSSLKNYFIDHFGWITDLFVFIIGATVYGAVYGNTGRSLYWGIGLTLLMIALAVHYSSCDCNSCENFFIKRKGWLTVSVIAILEFALYGFIFWSPAKTFIVITTFVGMVVGAIIHWNATKSLNVEEFFYVNNGFLTLLIIGTVGYGIFAFAYYSILRAIIAVLAIASSIVCTAVYKKRENEPHFAMFFANKYGAAIFTAPLIVGGGLIWIIYSKSAFFMIFTAICAISYLGCLLRLRFGRPYIQTTGRITDSNNGNDPVIIDITETGELVYRRR